MKCARLGLVAILIAAAIVHVAAPQNAGSPFGVISGQVTSQSGTPVADVVGLIRGRAPNSRHQSALKEYVA
jgi:hypothetical protein